MNGKAAKAPVLSRRLILEDPVKAPDGAGGYDIVWTPLGTLWAAVSPGTGREGSQDGAMRSKVPVKMTIRAAPEGSSMRPRPEQRFREGGRIFRITAVAEGDARARYLTCFAIEEVSV